MDFRPGTLTGDSGCRQHVSLPPGRGASEKLFLTQDRRREQQDLCPWTLGWWPPARRWPP